MSESAQITVSVGELPPAAPPGGCGEETNLLSGANCRLANQNSKKGKRIREKVRVEPAIQALDQDQGINARLRYSIVLGNEAGFFEMNAQSGELFLVREIDLEKLQNPTLSLQIQASQVDNPFRQALARVDISVQDINDNSPEVSCPPAALLLLLAGAPSSGEEELFISIGISDDRSAAHTSCLRPCSRWHC